MIGYCCDGDERLLVAEYMPNDTLAMHLFHCMYMICSFSVWSLKIFSCVQVIVKFTSYQVKHVLLCLYSFGCCNHLVPSLSVSMLFFLICG